MAPLETPPTPPVASAPAEIAQFLKAWVPPAVSIIGVASVALASWAILTSRVQALEDKVEKAAVTRVGDHELLLEMNTRLKLLVCRLDPSNCPRE